MPNTSQINALSERILELTTYNAKVTIHLDNVHQLISTMTEKIKELDDNYKDIYLSVELMKKDVKINENRWTKIIDSGYKIAVGVGVAYILYCLGIGAPIQ